MERVDIRRRGDNVCAVREEGNEALVMLREVYNGEEAVEIPSLKAHDGRMIREELKLVDGLMHNRIRDGVMMTDVNWLLYARSYVVAARQG